MDFSIYHKDCKGMFPIVPVYPQMEDITRLPQHTERPFRVFRCPQCKVEIKVEKIGS